MQVARPGENLKVTANPATGRATVERARQRSAEARVRTHGPGAVTTDADVDQHDHPDEEAHRHDGHGVGWLWVVPVFVLVLVPPPALGSFAAERGAATVPKPPKSVEFTALSGANPVPLEVHDYAQRAVWDDGRTLTGRTVELSGFVTPHNDGSWYLTRMKVNCCAADARPYQVEIVDSPVQAVRDEWVKVTGTWMPSTAKDPFDAVPLLKATTVNGIPTPAQPYE